MNEFIRRCWDKDSGPGQPAKKPSLGKDPEGSALKNSLGFSEGAEPSHQGGRIFRDSKSLMWSYLQSSFYYISYYILRSLRLGHKHLWERGKAWSAYASLTSGPCCKDLCLCLCNIHQLAPQILQYFASLSKFAILYKPQQLKVQNTII